MIRVDTAFYHVLKCSILFFNVNKVSTLSTQPFLQSLPRVQSPGGGFHLSWGENGATLGTRHQDLSGAPMSKQPGVVN